jgi:large subunit ribosomal protein L2|uniref:Ribosomal protein L2 n=1 Tax=Ochromonas danica TaxID=2986 RepID=Q9G918_OCHDN|nr:ribosomal protein L2 [Ochromonas danica]AAG18387.1 ribosomal protein L2 [Ochromonas danica]
MKVIKIKSINNSKRHARLLQKNILIKNIKIFKNLRTNIKRCYGRSASTGHITVWHKQRGKKYLYRPIIKSNEKAKSVIIGVSYDSNRTALTSINFDILKKKFFNDIYTKDTYIGNIINRIDSKSEFRNGFRLLLKQIPTGTIINNIGNINSKKSKYVKSAGNFAELIQKDTENAKLKLPSGKIIKHPITSLATIGSISNEQLRNIVIGKAGRNRNLGRRPIVRGVAMNPVDHPHGGRTNGGRPSVTPWGLPTKNGFKLKKK